ncbi:hypothetical protein EJ05DRAFT_498731 [Pseudovirgaria hyperparasitica]|uniref:Chitin-binding type-4 domain-containing protein n=1 Tax=Pseudovirgaria hyperparasitica TaxID=470096 RepID=A0A6A6WBG6_9PEZI|nr:uncharacterized protein EJ05DRAFT_498731 [Pseudovirgaria hyperparasitica]KAF2759519.1 hypothetical protein EJ05DRAFT_498731 [Pseudovirgaria hyperparasitica]
MSPKSLLILTLASVLGRGIAIPFGVINNPTLEDNGTCAAGYNYYNCSNGWHGCHKEDRCSEPTISTPTPTPTPTPTSAPAQAYTSPVPEPTEINTPKIYALNPRNEHHDTQVVDHILLVTNDTDALVVFSGIPAGARDCILKWRTAALSTGRQFSCDGAGGCPVATQQLAGVPSADGNIDINPASLKQYEREEWKWKPSLDFTTWDKMEAVYGKTGPTLDCKQEVVVRLMINNEVQSQHMWGSLVLGNNAATGFYLSYIM